MRTRPIGGATWRQFELLDGNKLLQTAKTIDIDRLEFSKKTKKRLFCTDFQRRMFRVCKQQRGKLKGELMEWTLSVSPIKNEAILASLVKNFNFLLG